MEALSTQHITRSFSGRVIIQDISIRLMENELVSLLGVSGSGKTTLFNVISGILQPDSGKVLLHGEDVTGKPGQISYMLQKDLLLEHMKVIDNVSLPLRLKGVSKKEARAQAGPLFEEFGLDGTQELYPAAMSGGMRQRAALLRTYLGSQGVALLDEPFSALDTITKGQIHTWYLDIMEKINLSTIFITHDIDEAILLSNRIYIMTGSPGQIKDEIVIDRPRNDRREFNLTQEFLTCKKNVLRALESR
ncbi:MAG: ABC transporter ATP-binding protein [Lachnospiraceae bacterium]|nr:ABC transporter ATP-binding protein [Lachnospiraceae bacterium]